MKFRVKSQKMILQDEADRLARARARLAADEKRRIPKFDRIVEPIEDTLGMRTPSNDRYARD